MALNIFKGTLYQVGEVKSGTSSTGRDWARVEIILDIPGYQGTTYKLAVTAGPDADKVNEVLKFKVGSKVEVACSIYAREWNGKYYNNIDLVNIKADGTPATTATPAPVQGLSPEGTGAEDDGDIPW